MSEASNRKNYLAEAIGTFALVFCGTGAIVTNQVNPGHIGHVGIALSFGLIVLAMIYTFGQISGAHFNPAVTLAFALAKTFPLKQVLPYLTSQLVGAVLASLTLKLLFPDQSSLGATMPHGSETQSFVLEFIMSYLLMIVILQVAHGAKEVGLLAGIAIGSMVGLEAMFGGPISGASMNPIRSLAPALVSAQFQSLWIYLSAPTLGMLCAAWCWRAMR